MFEYGARSDVEGREATRVANRRGAAVLAALVGALCLLSGQTLLLGLLNLFLAAVLGVPTLVKKRTSGFSLRIK